MHCLRSGWIGLMLSEPWVRECMWPDMTWGDVVAFYSIANEIGRELDDLDRKLLKCRSELHPLVQLQMILEAPDLWLTRSRFHKN